MHALASYIDHTILREDATKKDVERFVNEAIQYQFKGVCVSLPFLPLVVQKLEKSSVLPICVIDFPKGTGSVSEKVSQVHKAIEIGAEELDVVMNASLLHLKKYKELLQELEQVVEAARGRSVKVIIETCNLTTDEKIVASALVKASGAQYVKTSTGFGAHGATIEDIRLIREIVGSDFGVKASGGIRTHEEAIKMIEAGADRIGSSSSVAIMEKH
ncbi:MAG: deoxyribose-phosphate aldolase [Parachlamydiales bacterium]|nr:deoxyribose-phosphate aldolase [Parachlamydiales bacterium]